MNVFQTAVTILAGVGVIVGFVVSASKIVHAVNKKCPCSTVEQLQEKVQQHRDYFSNDSKSIKDLDKRLAIVEGQMDDIKAKVDRIDENVLLILKNGVFK